MKNIIKNMAIAIMGLGVLSGCGTLPIASPLTQTKNMPENAPERSVLVVLTEAHRLDNRDSRNQFDQNVDNILDNLQQQTGLYAYSVRKELLGDKAWTLTVWDSESSMQGFKVSKKHLQAMAGVGDMLSDAKFARVERTLDTIPDWQEALVILQQSGRNYRY